MSADTVYVATVQVDYWGRLPADQSDVDTWHPMVAEWDHADTWRLDATPIDAPDLEFAPGALVRCEWRPYGSGDVLLAVEGIDEKLPEVPPRNGKTEVMYIEHCPPGKLHRGDAWIGRVTWSKSGSSCYYRGMHLEAGHGRGGGNYFEATTGESYWVSGVKTRGSNRHWAGGGPVHVDADVAEEYEAFRKAKRWAAS